ncbi:hypothetical protein A3734_06450 [Sulfitobacter sp. HI0054]|uniref:hypothetical protein n=1 Tax=Sulfitobacter sp. HI0054 TaxID=1822238 RepID=UPI0007C1FE7A|nr:hypothetical protein [Sulfitobacter sp. HI0054]KZY50996.1 hypothetical protein A3734_06450 [Sulfitobacter sp. HI0054]
MMRQALTPEQAGRLAEWVEGLTPPFTLTMREGKVRTISQNSLLHKWYGEIARQKGDRTAAQVKGQCHREYGLAIKLRDPQWAWIWNHSAGALDYERQCKVLASGVFNVSSSMTVAELTEYMDAMQQDYTAQGVRLTQPEDKQ